MFAYIDMCPLPKDALVTETYCLRQQDVPHYQHCRIRTINQNPPSQETKQLFLSTSYIAGTQEHSQCSTNDRGRFRLHYSALSHSVQIRLSVRPQCGRVFRAVVQALFSNGCGEFKRTLAHLGWRPALIRADLMRPS